jgi:hypothetical protein
MKKAMDNVTYGLGKIPGQEADTGSGISLNGGLL